MTKSLHTLLALRGPGRSNAASGGWSIFAENSFGHSALSYAGVSATETQTAHPLDANKETLPPSVTRSHETVSKDRADSPTKKRRKLIAEGRFGCSGHHGDEKGIERLDVRIDDPFPAPLNTIGDTPRHNNSQHAEPPVQQQEAAASRRGRKPRSSLLDRIELDEENDLQAESSDWKPDIRLSFQGTHVFAGTRQLVEQGMIDGEKMPGWMTGEAGVSIGVVRHGMIMARRNPEC